MKRLTTHFTCLLVALALAVPVLGQTVIGSVKFVKGSVFIHRDGRPLPATLGQKLFEGDMLKTNRNGSLGVILKDDTVLSLGPDSQLHIDEFVYAPKQGRFGFVARMVRGVGAFLTGKIARLSPQTTRIETPVGNIGIRGTKFVVKVEEQ